MKHILYLLDGFSPNAFKKIYSREYGDNKKTNFLDRLSNKSIFFENAYGFGTTYPTVYSMFNGSNIYENFCDAPNIVFSFKQKENLAKLYKDKNFINIYYRNCVPHYPTDGFYKRFNDSITKNFDYKCVKKKDTSYNLKKFLIENQILDLPKNIDLFYTIHDMSLHDNKLIYNGNINSHLKAFKIGAHNVKENLKSIGYNNKEDTLFFLSDHGLSSSPYNKLHTLKTIEKRKYDEYYKKALFIDEKIKFSFFIKSPNIKSSKNISKKIVAQDVFSIIKTFNKKQTINIFLKSIKKFLKNKIIISLPNARVSTYGNFITNLIFHTHFLIIEKKFKIIFSYKHPNEYLIEKNGQFIKLNVKKINKTFQNKIENYFNIKNYLYRLSLIFFSYIFIIPKKIFNRLLNLTK